MNAVTIQYLWRYMIYADEQMLAAVGTVPPEGWEKELGISSGSVRKLVEHSIGAQVRWLARMGGKAIALPQPMVRDQVQTTWATVHSELAQFAQRQTDETVNSVIRGLDRMGKPFALPLAACMLHVADHATYHRGQLNSLIKLAGGKPSGVMLYTYAQSVSGIEIPAEPAEEVEVPLEH